MLIINRLKNLKYVMWKRIIFKKLFLNIINYNKMIIHKIQKVKPFYFKFRLFFKKEQTYYLNF